jgi:hypothetical protein
MLPDDMLLELIERVLKDPTKIFEEHNPHQYFLFYRLDSGTYFFSMYITGNAIRPKHKKLKEIKS